MKKIGLFFVNFGLSLAAYVVSVFLAFFLLMAISMVVGLLLFLGPFNVVGYILHWFATLMFAGLFFLLGTRLNLLGKHWLNYLSVCGIFVIGLPVALGSLTFVGAFLTLVFSVFGLFYRSGVDDLFNDVVILIVVTLLPSIFIWLGMLHKSIRLKKKEKIDV